MIRITGLWSLYFIAKIALHHLGYINLLLAWNVLLALYVYFPIKNKLVRLIRSLSGFICAVSLAWKEFNLPSPAYVLQQAKNIAGFSFEYQLELIARVLNYEVISIAAAFLFIYLLLAQRIRFSSFAWLGFLSIILFPTTSINAIQSNVATSNNADVTNNTQNAAIASDEMIGKFFEEEENKRIIFNEKWGKDFDVILAHWCSVSWDDLAFVELSDHPFIKTADIAFTRFNSATSYSGPASLRVLHGTCGQQKHSTLYSSNDASCFLFPALEKAGFETHALMNHDGKFDNFAKELEERAGLSGKLKLPSGPGATLRSFDNSLIYSDFDILSKWQSQRTQGITKPAFLYYNTITMHDGVRGINSNDRNSLNTYRPRAQTMLDEFEKLKKQIQQSQRPTVLIIVPEHGANLRGDNMQIAGMREIPSPRISLGPALVHLINTSESSSAPLVVDKTVSYFDLFSLLNDLLKTSPFGSEAPPLQARVNQLQGTRFVSESASATVMQTDDQQYWVKTTGSNVWIKYNN